MKYFLLSLLLSSSSTTTALAPPSFPTFAKNIVGRYYIPGGGAESVKVIDDVTLLDNGISLSSVNDEGFCYFDCGSYSFGPINMIDDDDDAFMASFSVTGSRVYVEGDIDEDGTMDGNMAMEIPRVLEGEDEDAEKLSDCFNLDVVSTVPAFTVSHELAAATGTATAWKRSDLQWEATGKEMVNVEPKGVYQLWLVNEKKSTGGSDMNIGIACASTGYVKNLVRSYDESGQLFKVCRQEGLLD